MVVLRGELIASLVDILLGHLHGRKPGGVFTCQRFGRPAVQDHEEELSNQKGEDVGPVSPVRRETRRRPLLLLQGPESLSVKRKQLHHPTTIR